ncbi:MAG: hypothetical protein HOO91_01585 [Bacteroidales bacterium]|nr:hypothetical protein [Bacteroidales bacterium]
MKISTLQILALIGILGGLLMFIGDMFFYLVPIDGNSFFKGTIFIMSQRQNLWLVMGALVGPLAGLLLSISSISIYIALKPYNKFLPIIISISFIIIFTFGGAFQTLYALQGSYYRIGDPQIKADVFYYLGQIMNPIQKIMLVFGSLGNFLFILFILLKKTLYPKWVIFFTPLTALLIVYIYMIVPYPLGAFIVGGWTNICLILFFTINYIVFKKSLTKTI